MLELIQRLEEKMSYSSFWKVPIAEANVQAIIIYQRVTLILLCENCINILKYGIL